MKLHMKITPIKTSTRPDNTGYYEQVLISTRNDSGYDFYPIAVTHVDTFWQRAGDNALYNELSLGNTVFADAEIVIDKVVG